jgi:hypothetical protein
VSAHQGSHRAVSRIGRTVRSVRSARDHRQRKRMLVARNAAITSTGYRTTCYSSVFDVTVVTQPGMVTYNFTLVPGQTLAAAVPHFAVQFIHGLSPDPAADTYSVSVAIDAAHGATWAASSGAFLRSSPNRSKPGLTNLTATTRGPPEI